MPLTGWQQLPAGVRAAIEARTGPVHAATATGEGLGCELAATLHTRDGAVWVKGLPAADPRAWSLEVEAAVNPHVRQIAPRLLWRAAAAGWDILAFAHLPGRGYADQRPGSPDLDQVVTTMRMLDAIPAPGVLATTAAQWWGRYLDDPARADALAGDSLVHRDLNPTNFIISGGRAYLVDWGSAVRGPAWLNPALLTLALLEAGASIRQAEQTAARIASWASAPAAPLSLFAAANARMWDEAVAADPEWSRTYRRDIARQWADHRASLVPA